MTTMKDRLRRAITADAERARTAPVTWTPLPIDMPPPVAESGPAEESPRAGKPMSARRGGPAQAGGPAQKPCGCGSGGSHPAQAQLVQRWLATVQRMAHGLALAPRDDVIARLFRFLVGHMAWYLLRARPALRTLTGGFLFWTAGGRAQIRTRNTICAGCPRRTRKTESEGHYAALFFVTASLGVGGAVVAASYGVPLPLALLCLAPGAVWSWVAFPQTAREYCGACGCPAWIGSRLSVKNACLLHRCPEGRHPPIQFSLAGTVRKSSSVDPPSMVR